MPAAANQVKQKQNKNEDKSVGSGESTNDNCGQNVIDSAAALACAIVTVG